MGCRAGLMERVMFEQGLGVREFTKWTPEVEQSRERKLQVQRSWGWSQSGVCEEAGGAGEEREGENSSR